MLFSKSAGTHEKKGVGRWAVAHERKESGQRVRKVLRGNGLLFRVCARAEMTAFGERRLDLFWGRLMRRFVGRLREWTGERLAAVAGRIWRGCASRGRREDQLET